MAAILYSVFVRNTFIPEKDVHLAIVFVKEIVVAASDIPADFLYGIQVLVGSGIDEVFQVVPLLVGLKLCGRRFALVAQPIPGSGAHWRGGRKDVRMVHRVINRAASTHLQAGNSPVPLLAPYAVGLFNMWN